MGLAVDVFTNARADGRRVVLVKAFGEAVEGPFEPDADAPAAVLVRRTVTMLTRTVERVHAELAEQQTPGEWQPVERSGMCGPMMGGAFLWSSDGRFRELSEHPVPLHDRFESPAEYATYD